MREIRRSFWTKNHKLTNFRPRSVLTTSVRLEISFRYISARRSFSLGAKLGSSSHKEDVHICLDVRSLTRANTACQRLARLLKKT